MFFHVIVRAGSQLVLSLLLLSRLKYVQFDYSCYVKYMLVFTKNDEHLDSCLLISWSLLLFHVIFSVGKCQKPFEYVFVLSLAVNLLINVFFFISHVCSDAAKTSYSKHSNMFKSCAPNESFPGFAGLLPQFPGFHAG